MIRLKHPHKWQLQQLRQAVSSKTALSCLLFAFGLSACGGGGGGGSPSQSGEPAQLTSSTSNIPGYLMISEVATNYYSNDVAWLEVHNPGTTPVTLSAYALRSNGINPDTGASSSGPVTFALPAVEVPPKGYLVIAGKVSDRLQNNSQMVYVRNGNIVPFWNAHGALELLNNGVTADFVRFGNSEVQPVTGGWNGNNVASLPSASDEHGKSIVRLATGGMTDTDQATDWSLVNFSTPAGMNDVPPGVIDSDQDGIPDSAKVSGGTYGGLDLYAMGARRGRRDVFVEIDYMQGTDPATRPRQEALKKIENVFAAKGIALHFDSGNLYSDVFDPARFNLGGGNAMEFASCIQLDSVGSSARAGCASYMGYKLANFDVRRRLAFHYALFGNSLNIDGSAGSSGTAELNGNDIIVALGGYGFTTDPGTGLNMLINMQASTLMHELGHNLGLRHGGNENTNYKPNHYSIMNYLYQFAGLSATPDSVHAAERYYLINGFKGKTFCGLVENSPCGDNFIMDYSNGAGSDLDETRLSEAANIGRGAVAGAYADWDDNNAMTAGVFALNINPLDGAAKTVLKDYNEWANLRMPFSRTFSGANSGSNSGDTLTMQSAQSTQSTQSTQSARSVQPAPPIALRQSRMHPHAREQIIEDPLPASLHSMIRNLQGHRHPDKHQHNHKH